jgi:hypothetical protein
MPAIRIPDARRGKVRRALVASGSISRISQEPIYLISDRHTYAAPLTQLKRDLLRAFNQLKTLITEQAPRVHR